MAVSLSCQSTTAVITVFRGGQELSMKSADVTVDRLSKIFKVEASSIFLQMDSADGAPKAAVFPQASGRVDGLLPGHRYRLCGDSTDTNETTARAAAATSAGGGSSIQPILGVSSIPVHSHAFHEPSHNPTMPMDHRSPWATFKSVAPRFRQSGGSRKSYQASVSARDVKKNVDLRAVDVVNNKLQLGDIKATTFVRLPESDANTTAFTDVVNKRLDAHITVGDAVILVDSRVVPIPDDEGTRDPDFWKVAARKISAVLSSDLDAMKDYLDSVREVDAGLDVAYSRSNRKRPAVSLPSLARAANIPRRAHGHLDDSSETLAKVASDVEDALHQLNNIDTSVIELHQKFDRSRRRAYSTKPISRMLVAAFTCKICHLFTRPPAIVTTCCHQWMGCMQCASSCSTNRCPLCNRSPWNDHTGWLVLRGLDELKNIAKAIKGDLGPDTVQSSSDTEPDLPSASTVIARGHAAPTAGNTMVQATSQGEAGSSHHTADEDTTYQLIE